MLRRAGVCPCRHAGPTCDPAAGGTPAAVVSGIREGGGEGPACSRPPRCLAGSPNEEVAIMLTSWLKSCLSALLPGPKPSPTRRTTPRRPRLEALEDRCTPANVHLVGDLGVVFDGDAVTASGKLAGLGNKDFVITADLEGTASFTAHNPAGNPVPGISKKISGSTSQQVDQSAIQNGTYTFTIVVAIDVSPPQLPNPQWTAVLNSLSIDVSISVQQGNKTTDLGTFHFDT